MAVPAMVGLACAPAGAQPAPDPEGARPHLYEVAPEQMRTPPASLRQDSGYVEVSGTARVEVSPDRARASFAVETRAEAAGDAAGDNAELMDSVMDALRAADLPGLEIETYGYTLRPEYRFTQEDGTRVRTIDGYTALNNIRVTVSDVDAVGRVVDAAIGAGANRVSGLSFEASDTEDARREALTRAVETARAEAATIAAALGRELGPPLEVRGGAQQPQPREAAMMRTAMAQARERDTPIEAGEQTVSASVTIKFALGPEVGGR